MADDKASWRQHVGFSDDKRHYVSLHRDTPVDVWLLGWTPQNDTGWHDHDISCGAVAVVEGELTEHNLAVGATDTATDVRAGWVFGFGPDHIHRLMGKRAGSVSVHAYSPPLWRMGQYAVSDAGVLAAGRCPTRMSCAPWTPSSDPDPSRCPVALRIVHLPAPAGVRPWPLSRASRKCDPQDAQVPAGQRTAMSGAARQPVAAASPL